MDIRDLLKADHQTALELAHVMAESDVGDSAKRAHQKLRAALTVHNRAEEAVVYSALKRLDHDTAVGMAHEGDVEHGLCDQLLAEMARGKPDTPLWKAKAKVVMELLAHHIEEEHAQMFPLLGQHFSAQQREDMGLHFKAHKGEPALA